MGFHRSLLIAQHGPGDLCDFARLIAGYVSLWTCLCETKEKPTGFEETAARMSVGAKRPKFLMSDSDSCRESLRNFSGAETGVRPPLHRGSLRVIPRGLDLFSSFLDQAKNEHQDFESSEASWNGQSLSKKRWRPVNNLAILQRSPAVSASGDLRSPRSCRTSPAGLPTRRMLFTYPCTDQ